MQEDIRERNGIETPDKIRQAVEDMADRLRDLDRADGVFGERMLEVDMDSVAGGLIRPSEEGQSYGTCKNCGGYAPPGKVFCSENCESLWGFKQRVKSAEASAASGMTQGVGLKQLKNNTCPKS